MRIKIPEVPWEDEEAENAWWTWCYQGCVDMGWRITDAIHYADYMTWIENGQTLSK